MMILCCSDNYKGITVNLPVFRIFEKKDYKVVAMASVLAVIKGFFVVLYFPVSSQCPPATYSGGSRGRRGQEGKEVG